MNRSKSRRRRALVSGAAAWLALAPAAACAQSPGAARPAAPLRVEAAEVYVELHPASGFLYVKEYYLSTLETDSATIAGQAADIARLVKDSAYCPARYGFAEFTSMEERVYRDRGFITVECRLLSRETKVRALVSDAFGRVLGRPVEVTVDSAAIAVYHDGLDVQVRGNNADSVMGNGDRQAIFWRNGSPSYEAVFGPEDRDAATYRSLEPYFGEDVASREVSEMEIELWRRGPGVRRAGPAQP